MTTKSRSVAIAMLAAAAVTAQFVASKAARDALFLTSLPATALPTMLMVTSACSILLVVAQGRWAYRVAPQVMVPIAFAVSGVLFIVEWFLRPLAPAWAAVVVYLHVSGAGPLLASGFWLIASERFDPRTAKKGFGRIAAAGTFGGLVGALGAERVAAHFGAPATLLFLSAFQFLTGWIILRLAQVPDVKRKPLEGDEAEAPALPSSAGVRVVAGSAPLRRLAAMVLLGTTAAALLEYVFKAKAVETLGPGDGLLRFFALYYAGTSLITFILQTFSSRTVLEQFGLALTTSSPSIALVAGSVGSLVAPGFGGLVVARAGESIFRGSWFRPGYELFYTPMAPAERRAAKPVIDVGFDRLGDAFGGGLVRLAMFIPAAHSPTILVLAIAASIAEIIVASTLNRWYLRTLERSLVERGSGPTPSSAPTDTVATAFVSSDDETTAAAQWPARGVARTIAIDPEIQDILWLRSRDRERVLHVLSSDQRLTPALVPHVIPLLAWDPIAGYALFALRKIADAHTGELVDALLDPNQDHAVRRRLARVFSGCGSQRAADALLTVLDDERFEIRFQAARSLMAIVERNSKIVIEPARIFAIVLREADVDRPVWESRKLLDGPGTGSPLDEFVRDRASQSLGHVFTLLSLVLPREPLQIAFASLHSEDPHLRGTALEYLERGLPAAVRQKLWPFLTGRPNRRPSPADAEKVMENLLGSHSPTVRKKAGDWQKENVAGFDAA